VHRLDALVTVSVIDDSRNSHRMNVKHDINQSIFSMSRLARLNEKELPTGMRRTRSA